MKINWNAIWVALFFLGFFGYVGYTILTFDQLQGKQYALLIIPATILLKTFGQIGGAIAAVIIGLLGFFLLMRKTKKQIKKEEQEALDKKTARRL